MMAPISEGTLRVVPVMNNIAKMLVVNHHQREHEDGGEQQPDPEIAEAVVHALDLAYDLDGVAWLELRLEFGHDLIDVVGDSAEVTALDGGKDLINRLDVRLIGIGRHAAARQCC